MPLVYRSMHKDDDGQPKIERSAKGLGVRVGGPEADIDLDRTGNVLLNGKGMSVAPHWKKLPFFRIPRRLRSKFKEARGSNSLFCFCMGKGVFENSKITERLSLLLDTATHGVIIPSSAMRLEEFEQALVDTKSDWVVEER